MTAFKLNDFFAKIERTLYSDCKKIGAVEGAQK